MIIAIDGPAGSGKTTTARALARRLNILYLDTGATYRALTYQALERNIDTSDENRLCELAKSLNIIMESGKVYLDGVDIDSRIRTPRIDKNISPIVAHAKVRDVMVELQRGLAAGKDCVVEGRDCATVVFPGAQYKFYLDADPLSRAKRRYLELQDKKIAIELTEVQSDLNKRDFADRNRKNGPLKVSKESVVIDTADLSIEGTVDTIVTCITSSKRKAQSTKLKRKA